MFTMLPFMLIRNYARFQHKAEAKDTILSHQLVPFPLRLHVQNSWHFSCISVCLGVKCVLAHINCNAGSFLLVPPTQRTGSAPWPVTQSAHHTELQPQQLCFTHSWWKGINCTKTPLTGSVKEEVQKHCFLHHRIQTVDRYMGSQMVRLMEV